ncbi:sigma factor-like helix-turn-helix DNA-binding protein [Nonomuraea pusilla]|uniref:DNA-directed RNA polymerase specialized sigma subunit, sigma24 family n=1 Tax=Nonomuraea pusilla TaxID=46177 RepID=A0A1H8C0I2_9ACTN|nr:sigma factor-like helix-turn-helix DNA-binding protein [Nonomuraea pusilla]SEM87597.1 DNA-directed RNA polymerase specialized sigma subunit, sigma24 family [Nonomuraea pusilla]
MSHPLTGQRPRGELVARLYDRHAAGLFAYCADQLGDLGSAADVLVSVLTGVPDTEPPRAALYAFARRQIRLRDVVYAPPVVDPLVDPASALVERSLRELRPHQREVLVLCAVCGLSGAELAVALDVAPDTAEELLAAAAQRFRQALGGALASTGIRVPKPVADVYGAIGVAPLRDVLGRLPWPLPPAALRVQFAGSRPAEPAPLFVRPRWPVPPAWPLPLARTDPATSTGVFPADLLTPRPPGHVADHEATTAPMPRLRDPLADLDRARPLPDGDPGSFRPLPDGGLGAFRPLPDDGPGTFRPLSPEPFRPFTSGGPVQAPAPDTPQPPEPGDLQPPASGGFQAFRPAGRSDSGPATGDVLPPARPFLLSAPVPADVLDDEPITLELPAIRDVPGSAETASRHPAPLFTPRPATPPRQDEPVYRLPLPAEAREAVQGAAVTGTPEGATPDTAKTPDTAEPAETTEAAAPSRKPSAKPSGKPSARARKRAAARRRERHHDWAWELIGFLICVAIAMIVFFSVPMMVHP